MNDASEEQQTGTGSAAGPADAGMRQKTSQVLRTTFLRGVVVIVPVAITIWVLSALFTSIDGIISPIFDRQLGRHIPGLGFISMVLLILLIGFLSRNLIGNTVFKFFERIISSIPLARTIYSSMKEVVSALQLGGKGRSFRQVVVVEYPRPGLYVIGFLTNELSMATADGMKQVASIYILNPPNPTSGLMVLVPKDELIVLDMTVEAGLKLVLSAGIVASPELFARRNADAS